MPEMVRHMPLTELARRLRLDGIDTVIRPGAQGKSARNFAATGYYRGCQVIVNHHSVSSGLYPNNDLAFIDGGKGDGYIISNAYSELGGRIHLIASGPTYTEGKGGPLGIIPKDRANDVAFSIENANWGDVMTPWPEAQTDAILAFTYHAGMLAAETWDWPDDPFGPTRSIAHFEWAPGRKVDPRGVSPWSPLGGPWDMDAFRSDVRNYRPFTDGDDDMKQLDTPERAYDSRPGDANQDLVEPGLRKANAGAGFGRLRPGQTRTIVVGYCYAAHVGIVAIGDGKRGWLTVNDPAGRTSAVHVSDEDRIEIGSVPVATPNGKITVTCGGSAAIDFAIDVYARNP